jgi:2-methylisocitrate lyase-like PEP mutase family enzyme
MMQPTEVLRTHIKAPDVLVMPGIFDGFSARLGDFSKRISLFRLLVPD